MSYGIKLTLRAQRDLDGMVEYTFKTWGAEQVDRSMMQVGSTID